MLNQELLKGRFMTAGFQDWLMWQSTHDMIEQTAREFGDNPNLWKELHPESGLYKLLLAAYSTGALNMGILLEATRE